MALIGSRLRLGADWPVRLWVGWLRSQGARKSSARSLNDSRSIRLQFIALAACAIQPMTR